MSNSHNHLTPHFGVTITLLFLQCIDGGRLLMLYSTRWLYTQVMTLTAVKGLSSLVAAIICHNKSSPLRTNDASHIWSGDLLWHSKLVPDQPLLVIATVMAKDIHTALLCVLQSFPYPACIMRMHADGVCAAGVPQVILRETSSLCHADWVGLA